MVVELDTRCSHSGPQHFSFPVVDGDLQVVDVRRHRGRDGLWKIYCSTKDIRLLPLLCFIEGVEFSGQVPSY